MEMKAAASKGKAKSTGHPVPVLPMDTTPLPKELADLLKRVQGFQEDSKSALLVQPPEIVNAQLRDYQLTGLNWLISRFEQELNPILGDEMGLGKTLQCVAFMAWLRFHKEVPGPFLVISPLSVVDNWAAEIEKFCPSLVALKYMGDKAARENIRKDVIEGIKKQPKAEQKDPTFPFTVFLTTPEFIRKDVEFLAKFKWRLVVVDEAHSLKNPQSSLFRALANEIKRPHVILMTGTPVQNNLKELWALLHFIHPKMFDNVDKFLQWFEHMDVDKKGFKLDQRDIQLPQLHALLKPFLLRRLKEDVVDLPAKTEIVLESGLSAMQKKYYKWVLTRDTAAITKETMTKTNLMNLIMHMRKCCNHPYLFDGAEPLFDGEYVMGDHLIENSGKMVLLDKLLVKLKKEGHRVLIFSQMTRMLDILQDYLHYRKYTYERLDGSVRGEERYLAIQNFNKDDNTFVFLLSTRAGGQGINLTAADTVVFFDSDWNPQKDLQAAARVHRIGQNREVKIIRFISGHTVEEIILKRALRKLELTQKVIEDGNFSRSLREDTEDKKELQDCIRFGLKKIFESEDSSITDQDIDELLKKGEVLKETQHLSRQQVSTQEDGESMYMYEGVDYSTKAKEEDESIYSNIIAEKKVRFAADVVGHEDKTLRKRKIETLSQEEMQERKRQKKEDRRKAKWIKNNYTSAAVFLINMDARGEEEEEKREEEEYDATSDIEEEPTITYLTGNAAEPEGPPHCSAIIINCVDDSGTWPSSGFFRSISQLSSAPQEEYELAGTMEDLELGSVHLVEAADRGGHAKIYVANAVVQKRVKRSNKISGILVPELKNALDIVAQEAKRLKATVHMPRIGAGTAGFNWYAIERTIQFCLTSKSIPTYVYYFKRQPAAVAKKHYSALPFQASKSAADFPLVQNPLPNFFHGCTVLLFSVPNVEEKKLNRYIVAFGGEISKGLSKGTTHIVTALDSSNKVQISIHLSLTVLQILQSLMKRSEMPVVSLQWIQDCCDYQKLMPTGPYHIAPAVAEQTATSMEDVETK